MALNVQPVPGAPGPLFSLGNLKARLWDVTFDDSYPTGGEPLPAAQLGFTRVIAVLPELAVESDYSTSIPVAYDRENEKLVAYLGPADVSDAPLDEAGSSADLDAYTVRLLVLGV